MDLAFKSSIEDPIAAQATPPGEGGIAVVRISGPDALQVAEQIFRKPTGSHIDINSTCTHTIHYGYVTDEQENKVDEVILLIMKSPRSYTGEDVIEFHCHGGPIPVQSVLRAVFNAGARPAEPGEFTRRAFINGQLDLTQAEAVADVIESRSRTSAKLALQHLEGDLGEKISDLRNRILDIMARIEVVLDYPEMDIQQAQRKEMTEELTSLSENLRHLIDTASAGKPFREGVKTVILGRPNVGKSSLMNALLKRERAIVTDVPGTTRDLLEEMIVVDGIPLVVIDTAGIRSDAGRIEQMGVDRARDAAENADLILLVFDDSEKIRPADKALCEWIGQLNLDASIVPVINKIDLQQNSFNFQQASKLLQDSSNVPRSVKISAKNREGLNELIEIISREVIKGDLPPAGEGVVVTNARHENKLRQAEEAVKEAISGLNSQIPIDLVNIDMREALQALGEITGETATRDLLERIFSDFCLGK